MITIIKKKKDARNRKLLGVNIDFRLTFNSHIDEICKKAGHKFNVLPKIISFICS